jgi:hypothetical protein
LYCLRIQEVTVLNFNLKTVCRGWRYPLASSVPPVEPDDRVVGTPHSYSVALLFLISARITAVLTEVCRSCPQSRKTNAAVMTQIRLRPFPFMSVHYVCMANGHSYPFNDKI